jgi:eukaryotic-like serine/threonine-protein kinase
MPAVSVQCPGCTRSYSVDESLIGRTARCKHCGKSFPLTASAETAAAESAPVSEQIASTLPETGPHAESGLTPTSVARAIPLPEKIGRFVVKERLGAGAFGTVYRAIDPVLEREVALKVPQPGLLANAAAAERFLREARAAAKLRHPHIVTVLETGADGGDYYIASQFIRGKTLADAIDEGRIDCRAAATIVSDLADALQCSHSQGIVHRDVKPANVMLDGKGQAYLMDFGLARFEGSGGEKLTKEGAIVGTPAYMAPEQAAARASEADAASDQFSLGATLFELLTGQTPFCGTPEIVIFHLLHTAAPAPSELKPTIPRELDTICRRTLAKLPADRYSSCRELADDLRRWLRDEPFPAAVPVTPETPCRADVRGRIALVVAAGVVLVLIAGIGWWSAPRLKPAPAPAHVAHAAPNRNEAELSAASTAPPTEPSPAAAAKPSDVKAPESKTPEKSDVANTSRRPVLDDAKTKLKGVKEPAGSPAKRVAKVETKSDPAANLPYESRIQIAYEAGRADNGDRARTLLASCPTEARGWEWYHCQRVSRDGMISIPAPGPTVTLIAYSRDGKSLAAADELAVRLWDGQRWKKIGNQAKVIGLAFRDDGKRILAVGADQTLMEWDVASASSVRSVELPLAKLISSALSHDGRRVAAGSASGTVKVWDTSDQTELAIWELRTPVRNVSFSPDDTKIFATVRDGAYLMEWQKTKGERSERRLSVPSVAAVSPDARLIASALDNVVTIHDAGANTSAHVLRDHTASVLAAAFSHDGRQLATGGRDRTLLTWDVMTGRPIGSYQGHTAEINCIQFSLDDRHITASSRDGTVRSWRVRDGFGEKTIAVDRRITPGFLSFSRNGEKLRAYGEKRLLVFDSEHMFPVAAYAGVLGISPTADRVLQAANGTLAVVDTERDAVLFESGLDPSSAEEIVVLDNNRIYVHARKTGMVINPGTGLLVHDGLRGIWDDSLARWIWDHKIENIVSRTSVLPGSGDLICIERQSAFHELRGVAGYQEWIHRVSASTGEILWSVPGGSYTIQPGGKQLAINGKRVITVCDLQKGKPIQSFPGENCSFDPTGRWIATWTKSSGVIWELATKRQICQFAVNGSSVVFSPDGRRAVISPGKIVDTQSGKTLLEFAGDSGSFVFSPDGRMIASASTTGLVTLRDGRTMASASTTGLLTLRVADPASSSGDKP